MTTLRLNTPIDDVEMQMRRALRVGSSAPSTGARDQGQDNRSSRRFAQSGDVPVTRISGRKDNPIGAALAIAEEALQSERLLRDQAEAALVQANATITALQTKLAHAEIAHSEALAAARAQFEADRQDISEQSAAAALPSPLEAEPVHAQREHAEPDVEEEPVQWWVPGWKGDYRGR